MDLRLLRYFVAVAEERHMRRAAERLHMTQPPLSRAIRQLEDDLGVALFDRSPTGVTLTPAGTALYDEARALLERTEQVRTKVRTIAGTASLTVGTLADSVEHVGDLLVTGFRRRHPHVEVTVYEADLDDPTAGLRAGVVDVALTRTPFDTTGISTVAVRSERVGVVMSDGDPVARQLTVSVADLGHRRWVRLPAGTDPTWVRYWTGTGSSPQPDQPAAKTIRECLQSVLWSATLAIAPMTQPLPPGLTIREARDRPPHELVVAWDSARESPLIRSFSSAATI